MADECSCGNDRWAEDLVEERDAALLEVERLTQLVDNGDKMIADHRCAHHDLTVALIERTLAAHRVRALCSKRALEGNTYVRMTDVLGLLDPVAAGGGATPGETPAATVLPAWVLRVARDVMEYEDVHGKDQPCLDETFQRIPEEFRRGLAATRTGGDYDEDIRERAWLDGLDDFSGDGEVTP